MCEVSIIVPVYNVEKYLTKCVDSILAQTFQNMEVILVDDGATDKSGELCDVLGKKDSRIRVFHKENGGLSDTRNYGLKVAKGKYVAFIDSDDYIDSHMIECLYNLLITHGADISCCEIMDVYEEHQVCTQKRKGELCFDGKDALKQALISNMIYLCVCNKMFLKSMFQEIQFPVGRYYEDAAIMPRLLFQAKKVALSFAPFYYYVHRENSITTEGFQQKHFDVIKAYEDNWEFIETKCADLLPEIKFRLNWAHFVVLDKMIQAKMTKNDTNYRNVSKHLKKEWKNILFCPYFNKNRKIGIIALKINDMLYRYLVRLKG